jgi:hypothetical protein
VTQNDERSITLFGDMNMNAIRLDRAMLDATRGLRGYRIGLTNSASRRCADSGNKFTSLHR